MERFSSASVRESLKKSRKTRGYNGNYYDTNGSSSGGSTPSRKNIKTVKLGDANKNHSYFEAFKRSPSMSTKGSPSMSSTTDQLSIWKKVKNGYYNMMHNLGGNGAAAFGDKRVPKARKPAATYSPAEFDNRVVLEIYKSMSVTS